MKSKWNGLIAFFGVANLEATDNFYNRLLGLPLYKDQGLCRIYDVPGGGRVGFCTHMPSTAGEKAPILTLLVDDVDAARRRLVSGGLEPGFPRMNPRFKIYHFFLRDPDGYLVEIQKFMD